MGSQGSSIDGALDRCPEPCGACYPCPYTTQGERPRVTPDSAARWWVFAELTILAFLVVLGVPEPWLFVVVVWVAADVVLADVWLRRLARR